MKFKKFFRLYQSTRPDLGFQLLTIGIGLTADSVKVVLAISYSQMLQNIGYSNLLSLGVLSFSIILICSVLAYYQKRLIIQIEQKRQKKFQDKLLEIQNNQSFELIEKQKIGEWLTLIQEDVEAISSTYTAVILPLIKGGILFLAAVIVGSFFSVILVIIIVFCSFLSYYLPKLFSKKINKAYENKMLQKENIQSKLFGILESANLIKSYHYEDKIVDEFRKSYDRYAEYEIEETKQKSALIAVSIGSGFTISTLWMIIGGFLISNGLLTVGAFAAFMMLNDYFNWPFFTLPSILSKLFGINASYERMANYCSLTNDKLLSNCRKNVLVGENIQFIIKDMRYKYLNTEKYVYDKFSLVIPKGKKLALIGESGSGKSTLAKLIMGLYLPNAGQVQLVEQDTLFEGQSIFEHISYVPQTNILINGTIRENISLGKKGAKMIDIEHAACLACAHDFIQRLDEGYETIVGTGSNKELSLGQIQRIAIARALFKNSSIYVFDEFSSAIDEVNEKRILENLKVIPKTMIFIAHKREVMDICDVIYDVSKDKVRNAMRI